MTRNAAQRISVSRVSTKTPIQGFVETLYSIFFRGNFAIHATNHISRLGRPASAGCVRLHPDNAAVLFNLARKLGVGNLRVAIRN